MKASLNSRYSLHKIIPNIFFFLAIGCGRNLDQNSQDNQYHVLNDTLRSFYSDGKIKSIVPRKNGLKDGLATYFAHDGIIEMTQEYSKGNLNGIVRQYTSNGKKKEEATFRNDTLDGNLIIFTNSADTYTVARYMNGIMVNQKNYKKDTIYVYDSTKVVKKIVRH